MLRRMIATWLLKRTVRRLFRNRRPTAEGLPQFYEWPSGQVDMLLPRCTCLVYPDGTEAFYARLSHDEFSKLRETFK